MVLLMLWLTFLILFQNIWFTQNYKKFYAFKLLLIPIESTFFDFIVKSFKGKLIAALLKVKLIIFQQILSIDQLNYWLIFNVIMNYMEFVPLNGKMVQMLPFICILYWNTIYFDINVIKVFDDCHHLQIKIQILFL